MVCPQLASIREREERTEVTALLQRLTLPLIACDRAEARARATVLHAAGIDVADAAHVAFAEQTADCLITCDDVLLKRCRRIGVKITVMNPIEFVANEVTP